MITYESVRTVETWVLECDDCHATQRIELKGPNRPAAVKMFALTSLGYTEDENGNLICNNHGEEWQQIEIQY